MPDRDTEAIRAARAHVDRLEHLDAEASPGMWKAAGTEPREQIWAQATCIFEDAFQYAQPADAALIVESRNALPVLLAALRQAARLVARLEAAEQALAFYADPLTYFGVGISGDEPTGGFMEDIDEVPWPDGGTNWKPGKRARAALAAAAPGETTAVGKPPLDVAGILWVAALDRVPLGERIAWVEAMEERVAEINEARAAPGETEQTP